MPLDFQFMKAQIPLFIHAAVLTLEIAFISILASIIIGVINSIICYYRVKFLSGLVRTYVEVSRNTPLLIQLFFLYFALPTFGIKLSGYSCAVIGLMFLGGGYMTEAFRAGIEAVSKNQIEAGLSIGLTGSKLMHYVILPQAIGVAIPAITANCIFLLKETSIVSAVAVPELLYTTNSLIAIYYKTYEMLLMLTVSYLILILPISFLLSWAERRVKYAQFGI